MILRKDLGRIPSQSYNVVEHHALRLRDGRRRIIRFQRLNQTIIESYPTQKLCVRRHSVLAPIGDRHHSRDHFVLPALKWQVGRHERAKCRERVKKGVRYQSVRSNDTRCTVIGRLYRGRVFNRVKMTLFLDGFAEFLVRF